MTVTLILDSLIVVLLTATVIYCFLLSRRLRDLRGSQAEFVKLMEGFNTATEHAEAGIARLSEVSAEQGMKLDERTESARSLCDELAFLVDRGERIADRLAREPSPDGGMPGATVRPAPVALGPRPVKSPDPKDSMIGDGASRSAVERDLLDALRVARKG